MKQSKNPSATKQGDKIPGDIGVRQPATSSARAAELFAAALRHHQSGLLAEAEALYHQILELQPNHLDSLNLLAVIAGKFGRHDMAIALLSKAIALNRRAPELQNNIAGAFWALGRLAEAKTHYERALALNPTYAEAMVGLGNVLQGLGKLALAAGRYERALVLKPDFAVAHSNLAATLKNLGKPAEAAERYARALTLDANLIEAHSGLGGVLMQLGRADEAKASCERALAIAPDHAESLSNLGIVLLHEGKAEEALAHCERATTLKPDHADAHNNLGIALDELGRPQEALIGFQRALAIKPDYAEAYNNQGLALADLGRKEDAIASYQRAIALKPDYAGALFNLHSALYSAEDPDSAIQCLENAVAIAPDNLRARFYLGFLYDYHGRAEDAARQFERLSPDAQNSSGADTSYSPSFLDSWQYIKSVAGSTARLFGSTPEGLRLGFDAARVEGLVLEFGVRFGTTIRQIATWTSQDVHGFDSFEGLPEAWHDLPKGIYTTQGQLPEVPGNVHLHAGLFEDTLPEFLKNNAGPVRFANIDCDIYSSTKTVLDLLADRVVPGTVLVFDEYFMNSSWREDEYKAFQEAVGTFGWRYDYLGFSLISKQAVICIR